MSLIGEVRRLAEALPESENPQIMVRHYGEVEQTGQNVGKLGTASFTQFIASLGATGLLGVELIGAALKRQG